MLLRTARIVFVSCLFAAVLCVHAVSGEAVEPRVKGFAVIEKIIAPGTEPVYQADGYSVRIVASTDLTFHGTLNALGDISPGVWVRFSGKRDGSAVVVAEKASFYLPKSGVKTPDPVQLQTTPPDHESLIDSDGRFVPLHMKVRLSDAGGWCGWHKVVEDGAQQEHVRRIGMKLIPEYQKQMADDEIAKIHFRFFVVEEPTIRGELACSPGLVLVPRQVLERLGNDDQVAAVLADGIGFSVQASRAKLVAKFDWLTAAEIAGDAAWVVNPYAALLVSETVSRVANYEIDIQLAQERGRLALSMMTNAGYDPWQAPEAWKLLGPKHPPTNSNSLKYPNLSEYQLMILKAQYSRPSDKLASAVNLSQPMK